jgi:hypothetical protein
LYANCQLHHTKTSKDESNSLDDARTSSLY